MAPMRSHIFDQLKRLKSDRKMSFWYGARSLKELFYQDEYDTLAAENENFSWFDPTDLLCGVEYCYLSSLEGAPFYYDSNHLTLTGAARLTPIYERIAGL